MQLNIQTTYDLNTNKLLVCYSSHGLTNQLFNYQTGLDHLNTKVVHYSDPHSTSILCFFIIKGPFFRSMQIESYSLRVVCAHISAQLGQIL